MLAASGARSRSTPILLAVALLVLVATACAADPTSPAGGTTATGDIPEVLDFEAELLAGGTLRGADLAGKDVAFWFWAPW